MIRAASMTDVDGERPEEGGGGPVFVLHSDAHTAPLDKHTAVFSLGPKPLRSSGTHLSIEKQFSVQTPAVVFHDPVPVSEGTQVRDEQGQKQQPRPHCAGKWAPGGQNKTRQRRLSTLLLHFEYSKPCWETADLLCLTKRPSSATSHSGTPQRKLSLCSGWLLELLHFRFKWLGGFCAA